MDSNESECKPIIFKLTLRVCANLKNLSPVKSVGIRHLQFQSFGLDRRKFVLAIGKRIIGDFEQFLPMPNFIHIEELVVFDDGTDFLALKLFRAGE